MSGFDELSHLIKQAAQQQQQEARPFAFGHLASYDPKTHRARVILPTLRGEDGTPVLTPWIKLGTGFSGNGYGLQAAPMGGASFDNPTAGEQVLVSIIDSDSGTSLAACLMFNDSQPPPFPDLQGGECGLKAAGGSFVRMSKDKSIVVDTSAGNGNVTVNAGDGNVSATTGAGNISLTSTAGKVTVNAATEIDLTAPLAKVSGNLAVAGNFLLGGLIQAANGGQYAGQIATAGEVIAKAGTGGSVTLSGHGHTQGADSHGDTEANVSAPIGGT